MSRLTSEYRHVPVMLTEVEQALSLKPGDVVCDCTLGGAGHTIALAQHVAPDGLSLGIDQDDAALKAASERMDNLAPCVTYKFLKGNFSQLDNLLVQAQVIGVDAILFDLGVSSPQLDVAERGFSYHEDAPLDMRMDPRNNTLTAAEVIQTYNEADLTRILRSYGDEKFAARIARVIVEQRKLSPIQTTFELVEVIKRAIPAAARRHGKHPARKTFQALRIEVNHELDVLETGLKQAIRWLNPGGRICIIAYHSLEDKLVKHILSEYAQGCVCPADFPVCVCGRKPVLDILTKKPLVATPSEVECNPRARSALLRAARRTTYL